MIASDQDLANCSYHLFISNPCDIIHTAIELSCPKRAGKLRQRYGLIHKATLPVCPQTKSALGAVTHNVWSLEGQQSSHCSSQSGVERGLVYQLVNSEDWYFNIFR